MSKKTVHKLVKNILDFEAQQWKYAAEKELAIQGELGISPVEYYMILSRALEEQEALEYSPALVKHVREIIQRRATLRIGAS